MLGKIADMVQDMISRRCTGREIVEAIRAIEEPPLEVSAIDRDFSELWKLYPHKVAKPAARRAFIAARRRGVTFEVIRSGLQAYITSKPIDRPWLMLSTFCNQERWNDVPAPVMSAGSGLAKGFMAAAIAARDDENGTLEASGITRDYVRRLPSR